jgi:hypothetical protein
LINSSNTLSFTSILPYNYEYLRYAFPPVGFDRLQLKDVATNRTELNATERMEEQQRQLAMALATMGQDGRTHVAANPGS